MSDETDGMSPAFHRWQGLTDAYAIQLEGLRQFEPGATDKLMRIARAIEKCKSEIETEFEALGLAGSD